MVTTFLFLFAQVAPIRHVPSPPFELLDGQNSVPRPFPSKKTHPHKSLRPPKNTPRKRITRGPREGAVEGSNGKNAIPTYFPAQKERTQKTTPLP